MEENENLDLEKELKKFNWGAAWFGLIWALMNGCFKKWFLNTLLITIVAVIISIALAFLTTTLATQAPLSVNTFGIGLAAGFIIPILCYLIIFIFIGKKGNRWAWESDDLKDLSHFIKIQKRWATVTAIFIALTILSLILQFGSIILLANMPTPKQEERLITKDVCQVIYKKLPNALSQTDINAPDWTSKVAENLNDDENGIIALELLDNISIHYLNKETLKSGSGEFKVVRERPCTLSEANCYISAKTGIEDTACRFYFDDSGNVKESKKTTNFLQSADPPTNTQSSEDIEIPDFLKKK